MIKGIAWDISWREGQSRGDILFKPGQSYKILLGRTMSRDFRSQLWANGKGKGIFQRPQQPPVATEQGSKRHFCNIHNKKLGDGMGWNR